jgi:ribonuclease P protein component
MLEQTWVSLHTVPVTNAGFGRMDSGPEWRQDGAVKFLVAGARKGGSVLSSDCRPSTQESDPGGFPRRRRLSRSADVILVRQKGKRIRTKFLEVRVLASPAALGRVGILVPKHKHTIVDRNHLKRQLRELSRVELLPTVRELDVLVRALPETYAQSFDVLRGDIRMIAARLTSLTAQKSR